MIYRYKFDFYIMGKARPRSNRNTTHVYMPKAYVNCQKKILKSLNSQPQVNMIRPLPEIYLGFFSEVGRCAENTKGSYPDLGNQTETVLDCLVKDGIIHDDSPNIHVGSKYRGVIGSKNSSVLLLGTHYMDVKEIDREIDNLWAKFRYTTNHWRLEQYGNSI